MEFHEATGGSVDGLAAVTGAAAANSRAAPHADILNSVTFAGRGRASVYPSRRNVCPRFAVRVYANSCLHA
jgi:hypothetical protein